MAKAPRDIASELKPGRVVPEPFSPPQWLALGDALDREMRQQFRIPASVDTIAIGWTSVEGLARRRFQGASKVIRESANIPTPQPHVLAPTDNPQFADHAEQDVVNAFIDGLQEVALDRSPLDGEFLRIYISHGDGPCTKCRQGLNNRQVYPGILAEFSRRYRGLTVSVAWKNGQQQLEFMSLLGGERLK